MNYRWLIPILTLVACGQNARESETDRKAATHEVSVPAANTVVASDSVRIPDALNELYFSVEVIATPETEKGVYEVLVNYGHNEASSQITMPDGDGSLLPKIKKGAVENTFVIGFLQGSDTTFNDYFEISATQKNIKMKYLKAYSFR